MIEFYYCCSLKEHIMLGYMLEKEPCEFYRAHLTQEGISIALKTDLYKRITQETNSLRERSLLLSLKNTQEQDITTFSIPFHYTDHKKIDWEGVRRSVDSFGVILSSLHYAYKEAATYKLSEKPQLLLVECFSQDQYSYITVGLSPKAVQTLQVSDYKNMQLSSVTETMSIVHEKLFGGIKKGFLSNIQETDGRIGLTYQDISAIIRKEGVPNFTVPGNCACLGANPDNFKNDRLLTPHNIDTPLQCVTMLVGVIAFWNEVLQPLCNKRE
jgi:hypothetical protein